jgi:hypothetical protein
MFAPMLDGVARSRNRVVQRGGTDRHFACSLCGRANEGAMRGNVLKTWAVAPLLLTGLLMGGVATGNRFGAGADNAGRVLVSSVPVEYCAVVAPMSRGRRVESDRALSRRGAGAMLLMLMAQRGRVGGLSR